MVIEFTRISANVILHSVLFRSVRVALYLANRRIFIRDRYWRSWLVRLTGCPIHDHHPHLTFILVVRGEYYIVSLANGVEIIPDEYKQFLKHDIRYH